MTRSEIAQVLADGLRDIAYRAVDRGVRVRGGDTEVGWPGLQWRRLNEEPSR